MLQVDGRPIPVLDLSRCGMRLTADAAVGHSRFVRGTIAFVDQSPLPVTGKVIRRDAGGCGVRLVTCIANRLLDRERLRLNR